MNTQIEDFIATKNNSGAINYNNIDVSQWNVDGCKKIFEKLLLWISENSHILNNADNNELYKKFEIEFNKQVRVSKITNIRKSILLNILNNVCNSNDFNDDLIIYLPILKLLLRKKPMRAISGITSITVITAPFPDGQKFSCKHNCYYCPNEPAHEGNNWQAQPRSYLYYEPAVLRANQQKFQAIGQMLSRLDTYFNNGHVIDKLEIIIEGGTYTEYPVTYLKRFHRDLFYSANIYFDLRKTYANYDNCLNNKLDLENLKNIRSPLSIEEEIKINKTAKVHIIGVCIETRPDALDDDWLKRFRQWGVTRVQLGAQHVDNAILKKINRGHTIEQLLWAIRYLKDNCFKIDIHIMPDLPGASVASDKAMFDYVYKVVCPDQMKVYPCQTVPWTVIKKWHSEGKYVPYFDNDPKLLIDVVRYSMETCPNWVRLPRVIRDIPCSVYVEGGNNIGNMRQIIDAMLEGEGVYSNDIRAREIGRHSKYYNKSANYNSYYYRGNEGDDYFIAYESYDAKALFGFIRLRIVDSANNMTIFSILKNRGLIRELHIYGTTTAVSSFSKNGCQHTGIGKGLLSYAERKTMENGLYGIAVISGEGVKTYYEKRGYREVDTFMVKDFWFWQVWFYYLRAKIIIMVCVFNLRFYITILVLMLVLVLVEAG
uniref:tRNA carboxymethyluridine synthase n=1 Tax=viral metagenome TaxID=1070528 RepID=A0A6C0H3K8_9ZZZZ